MISEHSNDESNNEMSSEDSAPEISKKDNQLSISSEKLTELGLDSLKPGDVFFAPVRFEVEADDQGNITGVCVQAMGHPDQSIPESDDFVELGDTEVESAPETEETMANDEEATTTDGGDDQLNSSPSEDEEDAKHKKTFGFPRSKTSKNLPKAKDIFGE